MYKKDKPDSLNEKGLIAWFVDNHVAANILMLLLLVGGIISVSSMNREVFPAIDPKQISVSVTYPGASPYEIADSITSRVEETLTGIEGVKRISSTASENYGVTNVEMFDFANQDDVYNEVEAAVNSLVQFPPQDAERPIITRLKPTPNVLTIAIYGEAKEDVLRYWTQTIEDEIKQLPGVALTEISGVRDYQISIEVLEDKLQHYQITLAEVNQAIKNFSNDIPAGTIESKQGEIILRVQERKYRGSEFEEIAIRTLDDGSTLKLKDIAKIIDGLEDYNLISKFNNKRAAFIDVRRSQSEDTLKVANQVKDYLTNVTLPKGLEITLQNDDTVNLRDRISLMIRNAMLGFVLVFLILLLFLDLKLAFWNSAAIPVSFLGGMLILNLMGFSINMISLFALIVVLGIVVDDGIIVGESIFEAHEDHKNAKYPSLIGLKAVIAPVTVGVTTTMAAFGPLIFSTGTLGQIIKTIPIVVIAIIFVSLIEAYFILPSHLSNSKKWSKGILADIRRKFANGLSSFVENKFLPLAKIAIKYRYAAFAVFIAITIITIAMVKTGVIRFIFFPQVESDRITINVTMVQGTNFEITKKTLLEVESAVYEVKNKVDATQDKENSSAKKNISIVESVSTMIGQISQRNSPIRGSGSNNSSNIGQVVIKLVPSKYRTSSAFEIESMILEKIQDLPNIDKLESQSSLIGDEPDINVELSHPNNEKLNQAAEELKESIKNIIGTKEVTDSFEPGKEEYIFKLNQQGLSVGLTPQDIGNQLRSAFFGLETQRFQRGRSEVIVYVRYPKQERESLEALNNARIRLKDGSEVPLISIVDIKKQLGYSKINTVDGRRVVSVTSDVDYAKTTPNDVVAILESTIFPHLKQSYPEISYSFEGETREQREDLASLGQNALISLLFIYVLLGAQLRSYAQPFVIMCAIPFGIIGAILGHFILGYDLTFISMFGVVALTGVVINDSVVLVDYLNKKRGEGNDIEDSALMAIRRRFRPILLTTLSTSLGLLPILLETSLQAKFLIPMVVSLSCGIVFATLVILLLVPALILIVDDISSAKDRLISKIYNKL